MCLGLTAGLAARAGVVQTRDGRTLSGEITLTNGLLLVASAGTETASVALTNLASARFESPAVAATPVPGGHGHGLLGYYFSSTNFEGNVIVRLDEAIDFDWSIREAAPGVPIDYFGVMWSGEVEAPTTGDYVFGLSADEGATLFLNGAPIVSARNQRVGAEALSAPVALESSQRYPLKLAYFDWTGSAHARLLWSGPNFPKSVIPRERLYAQGLSETHSASITTHRGLLATYFSSADFGGATVTRVDPEVDFNWTDRDPLPGFSRTNLSIRWSGQIKADHTEEYTFYVLADEQVWLWVDDKLLVNRWDQSWFAEAKGALPLAAGERYNLRLQAQSRSGGVTARLLWSSASIAKTNIPATHLFPSKPAPVTGTPPGREDKTPPGLLLRNGSFLAGAVERATETSVRVAGQFQNLPLSTVNVARILCQPLSKAMEARLISGRPGVLLAKGDFVDGDFRGLENGQVKLGSILFGTRAFDATKDVLAVVLREVQPGAAAYEVGLRDRSSLRAGAVALERDALALQDAVLGPLRLPAGELATLKRLPD
jgi:hypothetical protein